MSLLSSSNPYKGTNPYEVVQGDAFKIKGVSPGLDLTQIKFRPEKQIVTDKLVLHLDAGYPASYTGSGTLWKDASRNGNNATLINGPTFDSANGGSIVFDGTNDYAQVPNSSSLQLGTGDFTIEMWWYMIGSGNCRGFTLGDASDANGMELYVGNSGASLYVYIQNAIRITADSVPSFDAWHHYVIERTGGTMKLYVDGVVQSGTYSSSQSLGTGTDGDLRLGVEYYSSSLNFVGDCKISNFKIYKGKGLTAAEVTQNFNYHKSRFGL